MSRINQPKMLMMAAEVFAQRSTCSRLQVGAVISRDGRILSSGYNGAPAGLPHCKHTTLEDMFERKGCTAATHAEANAIAFAARYGVAIEDTCLYTTHSPCINCAHLIINSGISSVIYNTEYRDSSGIELLAKVGIDVRYLTFKEHQLHE